MTRTVTAFFDSRAEAEAARDRLYQSRIDAERVRIIDQSNMGSGTSTSTSTSTSSSQEGGFWESLKNAFMPEEDHYAYSEGLRRGGFLLTAEVSETEANEAIRVLDESGSVDFDQRTEQWRGEGWAGLAGDGQSKAGMGMGSSGMGAMASGYTAETRTNTASSLTGSDAREGVVAEEHIPIVEEELKVGKREVERGGARVRSYVREVPVSEQVRLREEHVEVERRPVGERLDPSEASSLLQDRTIEMTETAEEAVVAKEARVVEEVVIRKTADEHVEQIADTVRRTEVEVDEGAGDRSALFENDRNRGKTDTTGTGGRSEFDPAIDSTTDRGY